MSEGKKLSPFERDLNKLLTQAERTELAGEKELYAYQKEQDTLVKMRKAFIRRYLALVTPE